MRMNARTLRLAGLVQVVLHLHACPEFRTRLKRACQAKSHVRGNSRMPRDDACQRDAVHAGLLGRVRCGHLSKVFAQDLAGRCGGLCILVMSFSQW